MVEQAGRDASAAHEELSLRVAGMPLASMARALWAVIDLHRPDPDGGCTACAGDQPWPCPTTTAIEQALGPVVPARPRPARRTKGRG